MSYSEFATRDLRFTLLKTLNSQPGFSGNEVVLQHEAAAVGIHRPREVIRTELRYLESLGAVTIREAGTVLIGGITLRGQDHVKGLITLEGVNQPSPGV